jgi:hypothetical protein
VFNYFQCRLFLSAQAEPQYLRTVPFFERKNQIRNRQSAPQRSRAESGWEEKLAGDVPNEAAGGMQGGRNAIDGAAASWSFKFRESFDGVCGWG